MATRTPQRYRRLGSQKNIPDANKAVMDKTVSAGRRHDPNTQKINITSNTLTRQSKDIGRDQIDADAVYQLLPDVELAEQVLVGSILSPKDMSSIELGFQLAEGEFDENIAGTLLEIVKTYFKRNYKIDDKLDGMLEDILFRKGAFIQVVIPENNLDQLINNNRRVSNESFTTAINRMQLDQPMGFLGHPTNTRVSLESFPSSRHSEYSTITVPGKSKELDLFKNLTITDNFDRLKMTHLRKRVRASRIGDLTKRHQVSMESASTGLSPEQVEQLYESEYHTMAPTQILTPTAYQERPSIGHPLIINPPVESMIPVCPPGEPSEHVGYFMLLDENHRPVLRDGNRDYYGEMKSSFQQGGSEDSGSELLRMTKEAFGHTGKNKVSEMDELQNAYGEIIENDLNNRLRNGIYQEEFELGFTNEIYTLMLYRALRKQQTQLLYIPAEFVVYHAFNYSDNGVGQSLLKQSSMIANMRSILLFADTMSSVRNAIGRKRVNVTIDEDDPDVEKTFSDIQSSIVEAAARGFPLGSPDPGTTLDYLARCGFDFALNIDGDGYPGTKVDYDDYRADNTAGNPELQDRLRRMQISGWGMNPEQVDPSQSPDFATSVVNNNLIMTRRVLRYQKRFTGFLTRFVRLFVSHSSVLLHQIEDELEKQKGKLTDKQKNALKTDTLLDDFIAAIEVTLPSPDTTRIDLQAQAFDQYTNLLDRSLEAYINPDIFPQEYLAREGDVIPQVTAVIRSYFQRQWLERNNITPELIQLLERDKQTPSFNILEIQNVIHSSLGKSIQKYMDKQKEDTEKWKKDNEPEEGADDGLGGDGMDDTNPEGEDDALLGDEEETLEGEADGAAPEEEGDATDDVDGLSEEGTEGDTEENIEGLDGLSEEDDLDEEPRK